MSKNKKHKKLHKAEHVNSDINSDKSIKMQRDNKMPKVVLDKREHDIWLYGKSKRGSKVPNGFTHEEFRNKVTDALNLLAGHMGGHGIDLVDENGCDLSDDLNEEQQFHYMSPLK